MSKFQSDIGVVLIGRNEGSRLVESLKSVTKLTQKVIYVDSGSTDKSVETAHDFGCHVIKLDMSIPFSAGRARNEGFQNLITLYPDLSYTQFIDGDCSLHIEWLDNAKSFLEKNAEYALVCGQRVEKYPEASIYNKYCDIEWNTEVGDAESSGGDFMIRNQVFQTVSGFNPQVIAGEEPDLCYRIRKLGYKIYRADLIMTYHDADIHSFTQWWRRNIRSGYAYAQGFALHRKDGYRFNRWEVLRIIIWGFLFPSIILIMSLVSLLFLLLLFIYPLNVMRLWLNARYKNEHTIKYYSIQIICKFAEFIGVVKFVISSILMKKHKIIEYK